MIYLEGTSLASQLRVLEFLSWKLPESIIVIWNYPDVERQNIPIFGSKLFNQGFMPATEYCDGTVLRHSQPRVATPSILFYLNRFEKELRESVDSICLYAKDQCDFLACTIGHEGMSLVKNRDYLNLLLTRGFNASLKAPSWW